MREQTQNPLDRGLERFAQGRRQFYLDDADKSAAWRRAMPYLR